MSKNREKLLRKLGRRSYSSYELILKMKDEMPEIEDLVTEFIAKGYLNDEEWLASFIRTEEAKGRGPLAIGSRLRIKGFPREKIDQALKSTVPEEAIAKAIEKKSRKFIDKKKLVAALFRQGFNWDQIRDHVN